MMSPLAAATPAVTATATVTEVPHVPAPDAAHTAQVAHAAHVAPLWSTQLVSWCVTASLVLIVLGMLACIFRLLRGPHLADRALAVDTLGVQLIGLVLLLMIFWETPWFIDGILVLSLLGFAGTVAMAQYIGRPHLRRAREHGTTIAPTGNEA